MAEVYKRQMVDAQRELRDHKREIERELREERESEHEF